MEDTIAAIATAYGEGGIGIIRISGPNAKSILEEIFAPANGKPIVNRRFTYGKIVDKVSGQVVDEVMAVYMKAPYTYTKEDVAEINCHGSIVALRKTLTLILKQNARIAEPGEFTKRAFLNGRLDLSQAEAVIDLIKAKTDKSFDVAMGQMEGVMSEKIKKIREEILEILVNLTVNIDYPDEDIEEIVYEDLIKKLLETREKINKILETADTGRIIKEGLYVAIIGRPNVGKSSLMNALLKEARAIVTEIPGTTRDAIEENISIKNIPIKLIDTAGIRKTEDAIELIGIEKSKESFNKADLIIFMLDGSQPLTDEDLKIIEYIGVRKTIVLLNKSDMGKNIEVDEIKKLLPEAVIIRTAASIPLGISELEEEILKLVYGGKVKQNESMMVTNVRHQSLLESAEIAISEGAEGAKRGEALDFIEIDIKRSYEFLGEIIGETVVDDIINQVFARFCLGK